MSSVRLLLPATLALFLTACGTSGTTSSTSTKDALYFVSTNVPVAYLGETYTTDLQVAGGVGPYGLRVSSGKLPDGLVLNGRTLSGKATKAGLYSFTLEASDASLSTKAQAISLTVSSLPPLSLAFTLPTSEIRGETRLPLTVTAPRGMRAFRLQWALPAGLTVTRVTPVDTRAVAYWKVTNGTLTLDMGFRTGVATGDRLALVSVKPSKPTTLQSPSLGYNAMGADGRSIQQLALPSRQPVTPQATPAAPVTTPGAAGTTASPTPPAPAPTDGGSPTPGTATPVQTPTAPTTPTDPAAPAAPNTPSAPTPPATPVFPTPPRTSG